MNNEFLRFLIAGAFTFVLDFTLLFWGTNFFHLYYLLSSALAFIIALIINYAICVKWVFKGIKKPNFHQVVLFAGSSIVGLMINQVCMWIFVDVFLLYYMAAKVFATGIVTLWNFIMKRKAINL